MAIIKYFPKVESDQLPEGVSIQPRQFSFGSLDSEPKYWMGGSKIATHFQNMFSMAIPPGERFFIRSVQKYEDQVTDPEHKELIKAFILQEGLHRSAHNEFNSSLEKHGTDVERETRFFEKWIDFGESFMPSKVMLGITALAEHLTAIGAHQLLDNPRVNEIYTPATLRFWTWHAVEELEHRAVAFDLLKVARVGYFLRVFIAMVTTQMMFVWGAVSFFRLMWKDPTKVGMEEFAKLKRVLSILNNWQLVKMYFEYFKPGFHPWDIAPPEYMDDWYDSNANPEESVSL